MPVSLSHVQVVATVRSGNAGLNSVSIRPNTNELVFSDGKPYAVDAIAPSLAAVVGDATERACSQVLSGHNVCLVGMTFG